MEKNKDFICSVINTFLSSKDMECVIRHCYIGKKFKLFKGLKEMKNLKVKVLVKEEDNDTRYEYRGLWLCYEISKRAKCDYCGTRCSRDKLRTITRTIHHSPLVPVSYGAKPTTVVHQRMIPDTEETINVCPKCAYNLDKITDMDGCKKCLNRICGLTDEGIQRCIQSKKEMEELRKDIKKRFKQDKSKRISKTTNSKYKSKSKKESKKVNKKPVNKTSSQNKTKEKYKNKPQSDKRSKNNHQVSKELGRNVKVGNKSRKRNKGKYDRNKNKLPKGVIY